MQQPPTPVIKDLVLLGGGHSHVAVLKRFGMRPMPGVRLTLISRDVHTPYSGMLPGFVAGHYGFDDVHIDLGPLARFANARLFHDEAVGLDLESRRVICRGRPPVRFDLLSINIGSTPSMRSVEGAEEIAVAVKPINRFVTHWEALRERVLAADRKFSIGAVGAGAGGVELLLSVDHALRESLAAAGKSELAPRSHLFSASEEILPLHNPGVRRRMTRVLAERGVEVHTASRIVDANEDGLRDESGRVWPLDEVLWVTQAGAAPWLGESGLEVGEGGFVHIDSTLRSTSHPFVFAAGDVATSVEHPREKAGVFAVRQGAPLERNLRRTLLGETPRPFVPQRRFLSLISTGDRHAIASRGNWSLEGDWVWRWKDWIDRRFMRKFNELPEMEESSRPDVPGGLATKETLAEISTIAMRCGGCGAKVGATVLSRVLARLEPRRGEEVVLGLDAPDDAAVSTVPPGKLLVQTVDAFRAIVDDPYLFGKIAANHALGDLFAMHAEPSTAMAIAAIPFGIEEKVEDLLESLLRGAIEVLDDAGASLVGGHTSEGAELSLGFALSGFVDEEQVLRKGGMRPGDRLVLTKAIGTGTLFAADRRLRARGRWISAAIASMLLSSREAANCLAEHGATAATDVTGFGLLGHLVEMLEASEADASLSLSALPVLDGAEETVSGGIFSSLQPQNLRLRRAIHDLESVSSSSRYPLLFDPQTAGGLLASVPASRVEACVEKLRSLGYERTSVIGTVEARGERVEPVRLER